MPRSSRVVVGGGIYHVFARGNNGQSIFLDNVDRFHYLRLLTAVSTRIEMSVLAYVLMSNHVHLALQVATPTLGAAMHLIHRAYAFRFNRRHDRIGHTFNNRYQSLPIVDDDYLLQSTSYIHLNPVVVGLVTHPRDYVWSSYRQYTNPRAEQLVDPHRVLSILGNDPVRCRVAYEEFVMADPHVHHLDGVPNEERSRRTNHRRLGLIRQGRFDQARKGASCGGHDISPREFEESPDLQRTAPQGA